ncbi:MAG TPA: hypothetical protein VF142_05290 [Longimicrobium sp.]
MARKLALHLDTLAVESFATGAGEALPVGTVKAHEALAPCTIGYLASCNVTRHTCASFDVSCRVGEY